MQPIGTDQTQEVFRSLSPLQIASRQPWGHILAALAAYGAALWYIQIPIVLGCGFALRILADGWIATAPVRLTGDGPLTAYCRMQAGSRAALAPLLWGICAILLIAFVPWKLPAAIGMSGILAVWIAIATVMNYSRASAAPVPPFKAFAALTKSDSRPGGFLLSVSAHAALCLLPLAVALVAAWLSIETEELPKPPVVRRIVHLDLRPPEPVKEARKEPKPLVSRPSLHPPVEEPSSTIDVGKLDLSRMAVEFAADRDQSLPSVLTSYRARVAFVRKSDTDSFTQGVSSFLPSDHIYSPADNWVLVSRAGTPEDISTEYILALQDPDKCPMIGRLRSALDDNGSDMLVFLVFPRDARGFETQLDSAIRAQAGKQAAQLNGLVISRVLLAFTAESPGIAVRNVETAQPPRKN